jgi:hypothetical protein
MRESTIKGKRQSTIKGTRVHDLRSRSIIYRLPSTLLGKPTIIAAASGFSTVRGCHQQQKS